MSARMVDGTSVERRRELSLARAILGFTILATAAGIALGILDAQRGGVVFATGVLADVPYLVAFAAFPVVGYLLASRRPENAISWLLAGVGAAFALDTFLSSLASYTLHGGTGGRGLGRFVAAIEGPMWVPIVGLPATFLLLLFPTGHLPSPRWRWFARVLGAGLAVVFLAILAGPGKLDGAPVPNLDNPLGIEWLHPVAPFVLGLIALLPVGIVASLVALIQRYRRATGTERLQLRWLVTAAAVVGGLYAIALPVGLITGWSNTAPAFVQVIESVAILSFALIPIAIGISILRYRLLDMDIVVNRALLFGALAVFITSVYVAIVVGLGALVGSRANPVLSAAAAAVVALAFQPARRRAQRLADRLVYGKRATPYEVLSEFSERLGKTYASEELLSKMARALADGTGATRADVWVRSGDHFRSEASWPPDGEAPAVVPISSVEEPSPATVSMLEPVRHDGELLGALSVEKKPGDPITPTEQRLVRDLAAQAGLVMRNVALTEQLLENIRQLRASRQRLVAAQDEERRKLERNLHDGAQQQIVALSMKLRVLEQLVGRDTEKAKVLAADLQTDIGDALEELRNFARGIYPPLLADKGLVAALESQARRSAVPVTVDGDGVGRFPREVEAAVYFSCLEALQNISKYAKATAATVRLSGGDGLLRFDVMDDGVGFRADQATYGTGLQGIADRLSALGGELRVRSEPGAGTTVTGELPVVGAISPDRVAGSGDGR